MIARLILGYVLAVLAFVPYLTTAVAVGNEHSYKLAILMTAEVPGTLQVYYDTGGGLRETDSVAVPLALERREYELPLPVGGYRLLRIDPGNAGGRYTIERAAIRRPDGSTYRPIPLAELRPVYQLSLVERTSERLVVDSPPGSNDPQLLYAPALPFSLALSTPSVWRPLARLIGYIFAAVLVIALLEWTLRRVSPSFLRRLHAAARWSDVHPTSAVLIVAAVATLMATYPVVFLNRSLVSPNNHPLTAMLYDRTPFVPGSSDAEIEDNRAVDLGAMIWAIVPYSTVQRDALSHAEVPLWNRFNGAGRALWGQGVSLFLDPLHWLTFVSSRWGQDLKLVAHRFVFAAGVGVAALLCTSGWLPAAVAAAIVPFLGHFTFRFNHPALFSLSYAPWILVAWFVLAAAQTRAQMARSALLLAAGSALVLVASPPKDAAIMLASCQAAGLLALLFVVRLVRPGLLWQRLGFAAAAGAAAMTVTAPHWLVFLDTLDRSLTAYDAPRAIFSSPLAAPEVLLGSLSPVIGLPALDIAAMLLLIAALVPLRRLGQRPACLACFITAVSLLAVGFGAIPEAALLHVPLVANIHQIHFTTMTAAVVLLSVVCAVGVESLLEASTRQLCIVTAGVGLAAALLLVFATVTGTNPFEPWLAGLLLAALTTLPFCVNAARRKSGRVLPVVSILIVGPLLLLPGGLQVETNAPALDRLLSQPRLRVDLEKTSPAVDAVHRATTEPTRTVGLGFTLFPGSQALYDLEGIAGPDALEIGVYEELVDAAGIDKPWGGWLKVVSHSSLDRLAPLLDMLNVGFVLAPGDNLPPGLIEVPMQGLDRLKPLRRPTAWPRAFFADGVGVYSDPHDLLGQVAAHQKPLAAVQSTDGQAIEATRGIPLASGDVVPGRGYVLTTNTTSFVVHSTGPGLAVLTETFLPDDFRATLNGRSVPYFRVNHAFKAVAIPSAGEWTVEFEYRPHRWNLSLAIAGAGLLLFAGLGVLSRDRSSTAVHVAVAEQ